MNELYHHGIKGQKWGVRRYQNADGTLTDKGRERYTKAIQKEAAKYPRKKYDPIDAIDEETRLADSYNETGIIPKGVKAYRVANINDKLDSNRKYVSLTQEGRNFYENAFTEGMLTSGYNTDKAVSIEYKTTKNLKVASTKQVDDYIAKIRPDTTKYRTVLKDLESLENIDKTNYSMVKRPTKAARQAREYMKEARKYLASARNEALFSTKYNEDNKVFKHFKDLGYDAISDVEDGGLGNGNTEAPVIILNPRDSLKETVRWDY